MSNISQKVVLIRPKYIFINKTEEIVCLQNIILDERVEIKSADRIPLIISNVKTGSSIFKLKHDKTEWS